MTKRVRLSLPADSQNLAVVRTFVDSIIEGTPFKERAFQVKVAVSEASTNVIRHAYDDNHPSSLLTIYGSVTRFSLCFTITDTGKGLVIPEKRPDILEDGGYGISIMRSLCDHFTYETMPGGGTTVQLVFYASRVPVAVRRHQRVLAAAAAVLIMTSTALAIPSAPPGSMLYGLRLLAEKTALRSPVRMESKTDMALDFVDGHLNDVEGLYKEKQYSLVESTLAQVPGNLEIAKDEYVSMEPGDKQRLRGRIKTLHQRLTKIAEEMPSSAKDAQRRKRRVQRIISEAARSISLLLSEPASAGEQG